MSMVVRWLRKYKIVWMDGKVAKCRKGDRFEFFGVKPLLIKFWECEESEPYIVSTQYLVAIEPNTEDEGGN